MIRHRSVPLGALFVIVLLALAALGIVYGLWSQLFVISGSVQTGSVNTAFASAFTDDDNVVDDPLLDGLDTGSCPNPPNANQSCDPSAVGPDDKSHFDQAVASCSVTLTEGDPDQPGSQSAEIHILNAYPGYACTGWFVIQNAGTIPVKVEDITYDGQPLIPGTPLALDLSGDDLPDLNVVLADIELCQQLDPGEEITFYLGQEVLPDIPPQTEMSYVLAFQISQWNTASCAEGG